MNYRNMTFDELERFAYCGDMKAAVALAAQAEHFIDQLDGQYNEAFEMERTEIREAVLKELRDVYSRHR